MIVYRCRNNILLLLLFIMIDLRRLISDFQKKIVAILSLFIINTTSSLFA